MAHVIDRKNRVFLPVILYKKSLDYEDNSCKNSGASA
jgi:hypothetical protein